MIFVYKIIFILVLHTFMKSGEDSTKQSYYAITGFSYLTAMVTSNMALRHVNYPTQVSHCYLFSIIIKNMVFSFYNDFDEKRKYLQGIFWRAVLCFIHTTNVFNIYSF